LFHTGGRASRKAALAQNTLNEAKVSAPYWVRLRSKGSSRTSCTTEATSFEYRIWTVGVSVARASVSSSGWA
jgi:hypothetical protein